MWDMLGDPATHIGYVKEIVTNGAISRDLFYPITHIYTFEISSITRLNLISLHKFMPLMFEILYILFIFAISREINNEIGPIALTVLLSCCLSFGPFLNFTPNHLSNFLFPLFIFVLLKTNNFRTMGWEWKFILILLILLFPPFHILAVIAILITLISFYLTSKISKRANINKNISDMGLKTSSIMILILILFVWGITWISSFYVWDSIIHNTYILLSEGGETQISALVTNIDVANQMGYNPVEYGLKVYGALFVNMFLMIMSIPLIRKDLYKNNNLSSFIFLFFTIIGFFIFITLSYLFDLGFSPLRATFFILTISYVINGYVLYKLIGHLRQMKNRFLSYIGLISIVLLIFIQVFNGMVSVYPSSYVLSNNWQTTNSEIDSMSWLFNNRDFSLKMISIYCQPGRFVDLLLTPEARAEQGTSIFYDKSSMPPFHFGYYNSSSLSDYYTKDVYVIISQRDIIAFEDTYSKIAKYRWFPEDFEKLHDDSGINKIYSNNDLVIWDVKGKKINHV
ncbi:MAG: hypothetical protein AB9879_13135 [Methanothrix sp.]